MSFCGLGKKTKKRDRSPPYSASLNEEKDKLLNVNKDLRREFDQLQSELKQEKEHRKRLSSENNQLKREASFKKVVKADVIDGAAAASSDISKELKENEEKLQNVQSQIEELQNQKKSAEVKVSEIQSELKKAQDTIDTQKEQAEDAVKLLKNNMKQLAEEKDAIKKEKENIEKQLSFTNKELEIARKESHIPRSPTRAPSEEWKQKIEVAESEREQERQLRLEKEKENSRLNSVKTLLEDETKNLKETIKALEYRTNEELENSKSNIEMNYKNDLNRMEEYYKKQLEELSQERERLMTRLSVETAAKVLDNNPNIADLSDPNRPQKLGEHMSQLYDDEWTDASEALEKLDMDEETMLKTLLNLIVEVYKHCKEAAENQMSRIEEDLFLPPLENPATTPDANGTESIKLSTPSKSSSKIPRFTSHKGRPALPNVATEKKAVDSDTPSKDRRRTIPKVKGEKMPELPLEIRKGIKEYRKRITKQVWPVIEKEVFNKLRKSEEFDEKVIDVCKSYISRCVEICWKMRVQDPPMTIEWTIPSDDSFDKDVYRGYTRSGNQVEYVVWPAIYLNEGGAILMKGVAQGINR